VAREETRGDRGVCAAYCFASPEGEVMMVDDPHLEAEVMMAGAKLRGAVGAMVLLHGRGGSAADILGLGKEIAPREMALIAPEANGNTWYPYSFLSPLAQNEPWLSSALQLVETLVLRCVAEGVAAEHVVICGFSQGACLATEFVARHPRRYGALVAFTGGLIGPAGSDLHHPGRVDGMPALFSSGDPDPHVPWARVEESARELTAMGAEVELLRHPGRPHTVLPQEIVEAQRVVGRLGSRVHSS
jgi:phospholipase/carboxylesterase